MRFRFGTIAGLLLSLFSATPRGEAPKMGFQLDSRFAPASDRDVFSAALQNDGKVLFGGNFTKIGSPLVLRSDLARLLSDGSVDPQFKAVVGVSTSNVNGGFGFANPSGVHAIVVLDDGRIVIGGVFSQINGVRRPGIARLHADGSLDLTFDPGAGIGAVRGTAGINRINIEPTGKLIVAAVNGFTRPELTFHTYDGVRLEIAGVRTARIFPDGRFDISGDLSDLLLLQQSGGRRLVVDRVETRCCASPGLIGFPVVLEKLVRLHASGATDVGFELEEVAARWNQATRTITAAAVRPDDKVIIAWQHFHGLYSTYSAHVYRENGVWERGFDLTTDRLVTGIFPFQDGSTVIVGKFSSLNELPRLGIARLLTAGVPIDSLRILNPTAGDKSFSMEIPTRTGRAYTLEVTESLGEGTWRPIRSAVGTGFPFRFTDSEAMVVRRFYRVKED